MVRRLLRRFRNNFDCIHEWIIYDRHEGQFDFSKRASLNFIKGLTDRTIAALRDDVEVLKQSGAVAGDIEDAAAWTSNPTIFEKAITGSKDYDQSIRKFVEQGLEGAKLFERLAVEDIQMACDLFRPIYDR